MNVCVLTGRITRDIRFTEGEKKKTAKFNISVRDGQGKVDFINCAAFGSRADFLEKYCYKGKLIEIHGKIQNSSWIKNGKKVYNTEVIVNSIETHEPQGERITEENFVPMDEDDMPFE